jgi:predicted RNA-binding Zn ribbon-like protein
VDEPAGLRLVEEFLNTLDLRSFRRRRIQVVGGDALPTPAALSRWLAGHGLVSRTARASTAELRIAHQLRSALRDAVTRDQLDDRTVRRANAVLSSIPLHVELASDGELRLAGSAGAVSRALADLLATAARHSADGSWRRLRACAAPDCRWVFYDDSRSAAGRWCSMSACGNRAKTARYRARKSARIPARGQVPAAGPSAIVPE